MVSNQTANQPLSSAITQTAAWWGEADKKDTAVCDRDRVFLFFPAAKEKIDGRDRAMA